MRYQKITNKIPESLNLSVFKILLNFYIFNLIAIKTLNYIYGNYLFTILNIIHINEQESIVTPQPKNENIFLYVTFVTDNKFMFYYF